jgi:hypothetical protein
VGGGLAAYPALEDIRLHWVAVGLGALALTLLAGGLVARWAQPVGWGLAILGAEYAVHFAAKGRALDELTPIYAAGLMLAAELAYWSVERRVAAWSESKVLVRRLVFLAGSCGGAATVAALVIVIASASSGGGVALKAVGVAAAIGALGLVGVLVRRSVPEVDSRA